MDAMQDLGERIRRVRGYTSQEAFARQLGISKGALGCYERGVNCPNVEVILNISRLCHVSLEWLMTGKGNMADTRAPEGPVAGSHAADGAAQQDSGETGELLRRHCAWLRQRLDAMEEERRDLSRENRFLWQRTADLGERLARLEQAGGEEEGLRRRMVRHRPAKCDARMPGRGVQPARLSWLEEPHFRRER